jgi:signal transduction histidine kinase
VGRVDRGPDGSRTPLPQARLQGLLDAVTLIASELDGTLAQFVTVGLDKAAVAAIGPAPKGKGVLGQLITDPVPLRLHQVSEHPAAVGFPPGHPPMSSFLGVPIRGRNQVFGNLYLTDKRTGDFDDQDQALIGGLAAAVAISVENARLYERSRRRERSSVAAAEITASLLSGADPEAVLEVVAERAGDLVGADMGLIAFRHDHRLLVEVSWGTGGLPAAAVDVDADVADLLAATSVRLLSAPQASVMWPHAAPALAFAVPLGEGLLIAARCTPVPFTDEQLLDVAEFAAQATVVLELAERRRDSERLSVFADRDRIGRDLHDLVIQRLFATGMHLQSSVAHISDDAVRRRVQQAVEHLDDTVREIRSTIYALSHDALAPEETLTRRLLNVVEEAQQLLGFEPEIHLSDALDSHVPETLGDHVVGVLRESLSNVVRHAKATRVTVHVDVDQVVSIRVTDNGVGFAGGGRRSGLKNLADRAGLVGGRCTLTQLEHGGTELFWQAPLPV